MNDLVPDLIRALAQAHGRPQIDLRGQAYEGNLGRPDFSVKDRLLLVGHLETKAPGIGADPRRFRGHDRDQWRRFQKLPNVVYTDGISFGLYRSGERIGPTLSLTFDERDATQVADEAEAGRLLQMVGDFLAWRAVAPGSLPALAERLAPLCAVLRDVVLERLEERESQVAQAAHDVRDALFADRSDEQVADAFAQLCSYSMLLARAAGAEKLDAVVVEKALQRGHPVLGRAVRLLLDEETEAELGWALDTVRALIEAVDFERLRPKYQHEGERWLYFYETFLAAYDPKLRDQYGVYYTPPPVIEAQVALLDEVLRSHLQCPDGLADRGVTVLDPGVGTGSYLLRVFEIAAERVEHQRGEGAVPARLSDLARNTFAFEILVGPYAVAHLRVAELLAEHGATLPPDGLHVYLADTLDSPFTEPMTLDRWRQPLVEERKRAKRVAREERVVVCLGNPPYERLSAADESGSQKGGWVVHGEGPGAEERPLFATFLDPARTHTMFSHIASLYNLYVYFWRWALWKVFEVPAPGEAENTQPGVVSFISASSYLGGPGFLGMREHIRRTCDEVWVVDLGGEGQGARKEENVFAITTPVAICIAARKGESSPDRPARVNYARIRGDRHEKFQRLRSIHGLADLDWRAAGDGWHDSFFPEPPADWLAHPALVDLFPFQTPGIKVGRTWPIAPTKQTALERWRQLAASTSDERAALFVNPRYGRSTTDRLREGALPQPADEARVADITATSATPPVIRYGYRALDRQWLVADARVINLPRPPLWRAHTEKQLYLTSLLTGIVGRGPAVIATSEPPDLHHFRGSFGGKDVIPLYRDAAGTPNITNGLLEILGDRLGRPVTAEDLFAYVYAVLSSSGFTNRYWDELEQPGLRVPVTADSELFNEGVRLGRTLLNLHTFGERFREATAGEAGGHARIEEPIGPEMPEEVVYDEVDKRLVVGKGVIAPVAEDVWAFEISGLQVLRSWVRGRLNRAVGRAGSSSSALDAVRPEQWTAELDDELLEVIWALEATLAHRERQDALLATILNRPLIRGADLPAPTDAERQATGGPDDGEPAQGALDLEA